MAQFFMKLIKTTLRLDESVVKRAKKRAIDLVVSSGLKNMLTYVKN